MIKRVLTLFILLLHLTATIFSVFILRKKRPDIKWVVDFRDEWTNNPYTLDNPHGAYRTKREKEMEHEVVTTADMCVTNTPVMRANFIRNNKLTGDNFFTILTVMM